ncbi:MAG: hypothetical protein M1834_000926 [Cirrosporium novae-zelandiae]|nr:MAG: hypothetical protein M1834_000926 [Cirrosporium novae-zelandiae]
MSSNKQEELCRFWSRWSNEEMELLKTLRSQQPFMSWNELCTLFNKNVPADRSRTYDSITSKWKELVNRGQVRSRLIVSETNVRHNTITMFNQGDRLRQCRPLQPKPPHPPPPAPLPPPCRQKSDVELIKECFDREHASQRYAHSLEQHILQIGYSWQQVQVDINNSKGALCELQAQYAQLQYLYSESEATRTKYESDLLEERQQLREVRQALHVQEERYKDAQRKLDSVWPILNRIIDLLPNPSTSPATASKCRNLAELMVEVEQRKYALEDLQMSIEMDNQRRKLDFDDMVEHLADEQAAVKAKDERIATLEQTIQGMRNISTVKTERDDGMNIFMIKEEDETEIDCRRTRKEEGRARKRKHYRA